MYCSLLQMCTGSLCLMGERTIWQRQMVPLNLTGWVILMWAILHECVSVCLLFLVHRPLSSHMWHLFPSVFLFHHRHFFLTTYHVCVSFVSSFDMPPFLFHSPPPSPLLPILLRLLCQSPPLGWKTLRRWTLTSKKKVRYSFIIEQ